MTQTVLEITEKRNDVFVKLSIVESVELEKWNFPNDALNAGKWGFPGRRFGIVRLDDVRNCSAMKFRAVKSEEEYGHKNEQLTS